MTANAYFYYLPWNAPRPDVSTIRVETAWKDLSEQEQEADGNANMKILDDMGADYWRFYDVVEVPNVTGDGTDKWSRIDAVVMMADSKRPTPIPETLGCGDRNLPDAWQVKTSRPEDRASNPLGEIIRWNGDDIMRVGPKLWRLINPASRLMVQLTQLMPGREPGWHAEEWSARLVAISEAKDMSTYPPYLPWSVASAWKLGIKVRTEDSQLRPIFNRLDTPAVEANRVLEVFGPEKLEIDYESENVVKAPCIVRTRQWQVQLPNASGRRLVVRELVCRVSDCPSLSEAQTLLRSTCFPETQSFTFCLVSQKIAGRCWPTAATEPGTLVEMTERQSVIIGPSAGGLVDVALIQTLASLSYLPPEKLRLENFSQKSQAENVEKLVKAFMTAATFKEPFPLTPEFLDKVGDEYPSLPMPNEKKLLQDYAAQLNARLVASSEAATSMAAQLIQLQLMSQLAHIAEDNAKLQRSTRQARVWRVAVSAAAAIVGAGALMATLAAIPIDKVLIAPYRAIALAFVIVGSGIGFGSVIGMIAERAKPPRGLGKTASLVIAIMSFLALLYPMWEALSDPKLRPAPWQLILVGLGVIVCTLAVVYLSDLNPE